MVGVMLVRELMSSKYPVVAAEARVGEVLPLFLRAEGRYYEELPVVDAAGRLLGRLTRSEAWTACEGCSVHKCLRPAHTLSEEEDVFALASWAEDHGNLYVTDAEGTLCGVVEKAVLAALAHADFLRLLAEALDQAYDGVIITDAASKILYVNAAYTRILGVPRRKIIGRYLADIEPQARLLRVLETGRPVLNEKVTIQTLARDVVVNIVPIFREGRLSGAISVFRDITDCTQLSVKLQRIQGLTEYLQQELALKEGLPRGFDNIVTRNARLQDCLSRAARAADTDATVLLLGESGVGKDAFARAIHQASRRASQPFVKVNMASVPETLLESELFGYEEGAFTGSRRGGKLGRFEIADRGTIFLDEIGDASPAVQAKLLRVLQEKAVEKLGSNKVVTVDVRIIAATNKDLPRLVAQGAFRADLYYRLNVITLWIPPLRERPEDIPLLAEHFLAHYSDRYRKNLSFGPGVMEIFQRHNWPGNVRELQNVIEHAVVMAAQDTITPYHLPEYLRGPAVYAKGISSAQPGKIRGLLAEIEREAIEQALRLCGNNRTRAMRMLGLSRRTFYRKLAAYRLL